MPGESLRLWGHIVGDRGGVTADANARGWNRFPALVGRQSKERTLHGTTHVIPEADGVVIYILVPSDL